jgi:hypothetical protein
VRFMVLFYDNGKVREALTGEGWEEIAQAHTRYYDEVLSRDGRLVGSQVLEPPDRATGFRFTDDGVDISPGSPVPSEEWLAGFYLIECDDEETARQIARRAPMPPGFGSVELRPVMEGQVRRPRTAMEMA